MDFAHRYYFSEIVNFYKDFILKWTKYVVKKTSTKKKWITDRKKRQQTLKTEKRL